METQKERVAKLVNNNPWKMTALDVSRELGIPIMTVYKAAQNQVLPLKKAKRSPNKSTLDDSGTINVVDNSAGKKYLRVPAYILDKVSNPQSFEWRVAGNQITLVKIK